MKHRVTREDARFLAQAKKETKYLMSIAGYVGYFVIHLYTTRVKYIITNVIIVYISHLMMAQGGRNM
jgi:hypothetical protein